MVARVLVIAGSDSGAGAGLQADLKTLMAYGVHGMTAVTAVTAQNTREVVATAMVEPEMVYQQIMCVVQDLGVDAIKIGMVGSHAVLQALDRAFAQIPRVPVIWDPVVRSTTGGRLWLADPEWDRVLDTMGRWATLLTPNIFEAEVLTGSAITEPQGMVRAAQQLRQRGVSGILVKGGHLPGPQATDYLECDGIQRWFAQSRIAGHRTHGTGCTLSTAIAAALALGWDMVTAVDQAKAFVCEAIRRQHDWGGGAGPLDYGWGVTPWIGPCTSS